MPKYNLALIPISQAEAVTKFANQLAKLADKYLLGSNSLPHVTLYQFEAEERAIEAIWQKVCQFWNDDSIQLEFNEFSCLTFDGTIFWTSLLPNNCAKLHEMHGLIANAIDKQIKLNFDPHMTLFNTKNKDYEKEVDVIKKSYNPLSDAFVLSLGVSDDVGQLVKIIYKQDLKPNKIYKI